MGMARTTSGQPRIAAPERRDGDRAGTSSPAALLAYAAAQLAGRGSGGQPGGVAELLRRCALTFGTQAAVALVVRPGQEAVPLGSHPAGAAGPELLGELAALARKPSVRRGGCVRSRVHHDHGPAASQSGPGRDETVSVLVATARPRDDTALCLIALIGGRARWTDADRTAVHALANTLCAIQRLANNREDLAGRQAVAEAVIGATHDAVVVADSDGRIVRFNEAAERLYGRQAADMLGEPATALLVPGQRRGAGPRPRGQPGRTGLPALTSRLEISRPDGSNRAADLTRLTLDVGGVRHACYVARDITEQEQAVSALASSETRFRVLSHLAPVGIAEVDADGRCTFVNERWSVLTSLPGADCAGRPWLDFIDQADAARVWQQWELARAAGHELRTDFRLGHAGTEAEPLWVSAAIAAAPDGPGHRGGYLVAITNISARKRAEAERARLLNAERAAVQRMTEQTERLRSLVAAAIPGILLLDENHNILQVNQSLCDLLGIAGPAEEVTGNVTDQVTAAVRRTFADPDGVIATMRQYRISEQRAEGMRIPCTDGRVLESDFWPVVVDGQYRGGAWLLWNMSDRAESEQEDSRRLESELASRREAEHAKAELAEQNEQLRAQNEQKMRFLGTVSHELRVPLASIVSYVELLEDEPGLPDAAAEYLEVIQRNAERLMHLVGDLLLLRSLEDGVVPLELAPVSVRDLVADAVRSAEPSARRDGKTLDWSAADGPALIADRARILQVIDNLIANALKFTAPGDTIAVRAAPQAARWRIEVTDSGIGIPAEELGQLCRRFYRASNSARSGRPGFGLGLSIVKEILDMHGGQLDVTSTVGAGSTFALTLPAAGPDGDQIQSAGGERNASAA